MFRFLCVFVCGLVSATPQAGTILVFGDSLSAGYGLRDHEGWVALLAQRLTQQQRDFQVVNASISGDTTRGGLARIPQALSAHQPDIVIVELGANDGLRGLPLTDMQKNLEQIITQCLKQKAQVVLVGMRLPPNYGPTYTNEFARVYTRIAQRFKLALVPFLLQGLEQNKGAFQADQLHPAAAAQAQLLENVWRVLEKLIKK
ncbi:MAG: arylesterase [Pseudomonadota bacterium]